MLKNRKLIAVCSLAHGLNHGLQMVLPPLYLAIRDDLGVQGLGPVMLFGTVYFAVYAAMNLPFGFLVDRHSKKNLLAFGGVINSLAFVLAGLAPNYEVFMLAMVLAGLGGGSYHPAGNALIAGLFKHDLGKALGYVGSGASVGLFIAPALAGYMGGIWGWRAACFVFAGLGLVVCLIFWLSMPDTETPTRKESGGRLNMSQILGPTLLIIVIFAIREFAGWGATFLTAPMTQMTMGFSADRAGLLVGIFSLMGVIAQPVAGNLSDFLGRGRTLFWALLIAAPLFALMPHMGPVLVFVGGPLAGLFLLSTIPVLDAATAGMVPEEARGRVFGIMLTAGAMGGALGPYLMGAIYDLTGSYLIPYLVVGGALLIPAFLSLRLPREKA